MKNYHIIINKKDGQKINFDYQANTISQVHEHIAQYLIDSNTQSDVEKINVYRIIVDNNNQIDVDALQDASLTIVKRTTANMVNKQATTLSHTLYNACRQQTVINTDILDMISVVQLSIIESIDKQYDIVSIYKQAYSDLNAYLYSVQQIKIEKAGMRTIYIEDVNGDIVSVNDKIAQIINHNDTYYYVDDSDSDIINLSHDIISNIMQHLTATQKTVLKHMTYNLSVRQIAEKMGRHSSTIQEHISKIRKIAKELYPQGYKNQ